MEAFFDPFQINKYFQDVPHDIATSDDRKLQFATPMHMKEHITIFEGRATVQSIRHVSRSSTANFNKRHLHLGDNVDMVLAFDRGRATGLPLLFCCRRAAAYSILWSQGALFITDGFRQNLTKQMVLRAAGKGRPKVRQPQKPKSARASSRSSAQRGRRQVRNPCLDPQPLIIHALKEAVFTEVRGVPSLSYGICSVEKTRKRGATRGPRSPRTWFQCCVSRGRPCWKALRFLLKQLWIITAEGWYPITSASYRAWRTLPLVM